ncbi:MAG: OmpA family protein [Gemmatimonadetes bacterium]|nr:OmpA family protein [Gemmatimonadota bacterium]
MVTTDGTTVVAPDRPPLEISPCTLVSARSPWWPSRCRLSPPPDKAAAEKAAAEAAARYAEAVAGARATFATPVFFDYDKAAIRDDQKATLEAKLPLFEANPDIRIRVSGHTDNRGSDEYNLALGQRRAAEVKRYLVARGIAESRIDVVSFGEERPAVAQDNEDAWGKNRRDEFEITAGGNPLKLPNK